MGRNKIKLVKELDYFSAAIWYAERFGLRNPGLNRWMCSNIDEIFSTLNSRTFTHLVTDSINIIMLFIFPTKKKCLSLFANRMLF